jgi:hypothetical protein
MHYVLFSDSAPTPSLKPRTSQQPTSRRAFEIWPRALMKLCPQVEYNLLFGFFITVSSFIVVDSLVITSSFVVGRVLSSQKSCLHLVDACAWRQGWAEVHIWNESHTHQAWKSHMAWQPHWLPRMVPSSHLALWDISLWARLGSYLYPNHITRFR